MAGNELQRRREIAGMSRANLAIMLAVTWQTIWNWETGRVPISGPVERLVRILLPLAEEQVAV